MRFAYHYSIVLSKILRMIIAAAAFVSLPAMAASPKEEVIAAAVKLADQPNYTWITTVSVPEGSRFQPGTSEGSTEKEGWTYLISKRAGRTAESVVKGENVALTSPEGV